MDMTLFEVDEAANRIREEVDPEANIIFGSTFDEKLEGRMRISVVATGIDAEVQLQPRPVISLVSDRSREETPIPMPNLAPAAARAPTMAAGDPGHFAALEPEETSPQAEAIEAAAVRNGAFMAPRPVEPAVARPAPAAQPAYTAAHGTASEAGSAQKQKSRTPSLFERVTGASRLLHGGSAEPAARPAAQPPQPRLGTLDPADRLAPAKEEDLLDIPAFLRRQAN
jgi:cell division protein FtsZ